MTLGIVKRLLPEPVKAWTRRLRASWIAKLARRTNLSREPISHLFLKGSGIEIGALNNPLSVSSSAKVQYVDRLSTNDLKRLYVDVEASTILPVSIVTDGDTLTGIPNHSQDFVISNHMVEHVEDPIGTIRHFLRVLRIGGVVFMTLPDKRLTFDSDRSLTSFEHVVRDYFEGPATSRNPHYAEWAAVVERVEGREAIAERARALESERANIHFHVWDQAAMMEMLARMQLELMFNFDVEIMSRTGLEVIFVIRKTGPVPPAPVS